MAAMAHLQSQRFDVLGRHIPHKEMYAATDAE
jgi:hypothetical protein